MPSHLQRLQLADQGYEGLGRLRVQDSICVHLELCLADGLNAAQVHLHDDACKADAAPSTVHPQMKAQSASGLP